MADSLVSIGYVFLVQPGKNGVLVGKIGEIDCLPALVPNPGCDNPRFLFQVLCGLLALSALGNSDQVTLASAKERSLESTERIGQWAAFVPLDR